MSHERNAVGRTAGGGIMTHPTTRVGAAPNALEGAAPNALESTASYVPGGTAPYVPERDGAGVPTRAGEIVALAGAVLIGLSLVWVAGHAQAAALHDAAHDTRHATGFPCH